MTSKADFNPSIVESKECIVEGVIETKYVKALEVLLHSISGNHKKHMKVHEIVLKRERSLGIGSQEVRLQCSFQEPEPLWTVSHIGGALRGAASDKIPVLVRNRDDSRVSNNALRFFDLVGYKFDHELLRVGFALTTIQKVVGMEGTHKDYEITVSVTSIHKIPKKFEIDKAEPLTPGIHLVEVYTGSTSDNYTEAVSAITAFSEILAPIIHLSKPGISTGAPSTASAAATSIMSRGSRRVP